jgi:hypothetical protein
MNKQFWIKENRLTLLGRMRLKATVLTGYWPATLGGMKAEVGIGAWPSPRPKPALLARTLGAGMVTTF